MTHRSGKHAKSQIEGSLLSQASQQSLSDKELMPLDRRALSTRILRDLGQTPQLPDRSISSYS